MPRGELHFGGMNYKVAIKKFFKPDELIEATRRAEYRGLRHQGGYVMKAARASIVKPARKNARSAPGKPPFSQTGRLRSSILFTYDNSSHSVVVGAFSFGSKGNAVPGALEHGGQVKIDETVFAWEKNSRNKMVRRRKKTGRKKTVTVKARPYMGPALERSKSALDAIWKNSIGAK